jgi:hypothetical protein
MRERTIVNIRRMPLIVRRLFIGLTTTRIGPARVRRLSLERVLFLFLSFHSVGVELS